MRLYLYSALIVVLASALAPVSACSIPARPLIDRPEIYTDIFVGEVLAVEVIGPAKIAGENSGTIIGFSPLHNITVKVTKTVKGGKAGEVILENVTGCGLQIPEVGQWTTFYLVDDVIVPDIYKPQRKTRSTLLK